jgi:hypothetical protein
MKNLIIYQLGILVFLTVFSCKKDHSQTNSVPGDPSAEVLIAGNYTPANNIVSAAYWKSGQFYPLEDGSNLASHAYGIIQYNGHIYVAGDYGGKACIWEDGVRNIIEQNFNGFVKGFALHKVNAELHLVLFGAKGTAQNVTPRAFAMDWVSKAILYENNQNQESAIYGFNSESGTIYMSGIIASQATLIKVGLGENQLGGSSLVGPLRYHNSKYYFASYFKVDPNVTESGYFENTSFISLGLSSQLYLTDLDFDEMGTLILAGTSFDVNQVNHATIWENKIPTVLSISSSRAEALAIYNKFVYVVGRENSTACYWVNKQLVSLKTPNSVATAIYVSAKN